MAISSRVQQEFFQPRQDQGEPEATQQLVRIAQTRQRHSTASFAPSSNALTAQGHRPQLAKPASCSSSTSSNGHWTAEEHDRFLQAIECCPRGPWKAIAAIVGTKTARQAMSHGQKYRQKIARRQRSLNRTPSPVVNSDYHVHPSAETKPLIDHSTPSTRARQPSTSLESPRMVSTTATMAHAQQSMSLCPQALTHRQRLPHLPGLLCQPDLLLNHRGWEFSNQQLDPQDIQGLLECLCAD